MVFRYWFLVGSWWLTTARRPGKARKRERIPSIPSSKRHSWTIGNI